MKGLGEDAGVLRRRVRGVERYGGEARDEHNLDFRVELSGATSKLDAVHLRHDNIGQQEVERFLAQPIVRGQPVVERSYVVAGVLQRLDEKAAHGVIVLRKQDLGGNLDWRLHRAPLVNRATLRRPSKNLLNP